MSDELIWTQEDEALLRQFLNSNTGHKFLPKLAEAAPVLLDGGHANKTLVRNGELRGYQSALREIILLSQPPPSELKEIRAYPDLTDDSAWPDTEKLNPPK